MPALIFKVQMYYLPLMFKLLAEIRHNALKNPIQNYKIKTVNCKKISSVCLY